MPVPMHSAWPASRFQHPKEPVPGPGIYLPGPSRIWRPGIEEIELYPVNEPYAYIRIFYDHSTHEYTYSVLEPQLSPAEEDLFRDI